MTDWRIQGQERYLSGVKLQRKSYSPYREGWDHDHCEFCGRKLSLMSGDLSHGYVTLDNYHWVCDDCFADFQEAFGWTVSEASEADGAPGAASG